MIDFIYNDLQNALSIFFFPFYPISATLFICAALLKSEKIRFNLPFKLLSALALIPCTLALMYYILEQIYLPMEGGRVYVISYFTPGILLNFISAVIIFLSKQNQSK